RPVHPLDDAPVALDAGDLVAERHQVELLSAGLVAEAGGLQQRGQERAGIADGDLLQLLVAPENALGEADERGGLDVRRQDGREVAGVALDQRLGLVALGDGGGNGLGHLMSFLGLAGMSLSTVVALRTCWATVYFARGAAGSTPLVAALGASPVAAWHSPQLRSSRS